MIWVGLIAAVYALIVIASIHYRLKRLWERVLKQQGRFETLLQTPHEPSEIASSREALDKSVRIYNAALDLSPTKQVAALFRFGKAHTAPEHSA